MRSLFRHTAGAAGLRGLALAALIAPTAAPAQQAGDLILSAGWMHFQPQDSSETMRLTFPRAQEMPGTHSSVSTSNTLGLSAIYMLTDHWAVEGVLGVPPKFRLYGEDTLAPVGQLGSARQWSPALLGRYYFGEPTSRLRFSLGAGVSYVWYSQVNLTPGMQAAVGSKLGLPPGASSTTAELSRSWAPVLNAGIDYQINRHWGVGFSLSYLPLKTTASMTTRVAGQTVARSQARLTLDPVVGFLKVNYRF